MPEITLPDLRLQWSSAGDILKPSDAKIQQGWQVEIPPRQWFNWLDNRQDQAIAHIAQHGIAVWSPDLEYQENKSYVQGSTGTIYRCVSTHTNQNPDNDPSNTYWKVSFADAGEYYTKTEVNARTTIATTPQAQALSSNTTLLTPLRLGDAFKGANSSLAVAGFQRLPSGLLIQWGSVSGTNNDEPQTFSIPFTALFTITATPVASSKSAMSVVQIYEPTTTGFNQYRQTLSGSSSNLGFRWVAFGI